MRLATDDRKIVSRVEPITEREALENLFMALVRVTILDLSLGDPEALAWCTDLDMDGPFSVTGVAAMFGAEASVLVRWMVLKARQVREKERQAREAGPTVVQTEPAPQSPPPPHPTHPRT